MHLSNWHNTSGCLSVVEYATLASLYLHPSVGGGGQVLLHV